MIRVLKILLLSLCVTLAVFVAYEDVCADSVSGIVLPGNEDSLTNEDSWRKIPNSYPAIFHYSRTRDREFTNWALGNPMIRSTDFKAPSAFMNERNFATGFGDKSTLELDTRSPLVPHAPVVPIPGPFLLLASGFVGLIGLRWRHRKR